MNDIMSHDSQQAITHVLQQDSKVLDALMLKIKQHTQLQQILAEYLDAKLINHCQVANLDNGCLIILTDSALWATQFRFQIPDLLAKLRQHPQLYHLKHIYCKIRPAPARRQIPEANQMPMPRITVATSHMIMEAANTIQHDKLKAIMQKIAKNTAKPKP
jgi:hypothetical protein